MLQSKLKSLLSSAGIDVTGKSNYSLRATGISHMYNSGVPEKLIMERSGHLSSKEVQVYERTTTKQQQVVCGVLVQIGQVYGENLAAAETKRELFAEAQPKGNMAEHMAGDLQKAPQVIKMEGCTMNITMQLK